MYSESVTESYYVSFTADTQTLAPDSERTRSRNPVVKEDTTLQQNSKEEKDYDFVLLLLVPSLRALPKKKLTFERFESLVTNCKNKADKKSSGGLERRMQRQLCLKPQQGRGSGVPCCQEATQEDGSKYVLARI
jgi:hypothetical protein